MFNLSIEKAQMLQQKIQEIKNRLDNDIFIHTSQDIVITISVIGNIKDISNPQNKTLKEIISVLNEALTKARRDYEIKQAQLLQKEMLNI